MATIQDYRKLNESFSRKFIFRFGTGMGFYSELNALMLTALYCLKYKYKFVMYSQNAAFAFGKGWDDFFEPFCPTYKFGLFGKCIRREYILNGGKSKIAHLHKLVSNSLLLPDIYWYCRSAWFQYEKFDIPELGIKGDIREALRVLVPIIYRFNPEYSKLITEFENRLNLPDHYVSMQVRGGDKVIERELITPQRYIDAAAQAQDKRTAFVFTDDYNLYEILKRDNPSWNIITSADPEDCGYVNDAFKKQSPEIKKKNLIKMFASVDLILKSDLFVGTFSSNPGLFAGMTLPDEKMIGLDFDKWLII